MSQTVTHTGAYNVKVVDTLSLQTTSTEVGLGPGHTALDADPGPQ